MCRALCLLFLFALSAACAAPVTSAFHIQKWEVNRTPMIFAYLPEPASVQMPALCFWQGRGADYQHPTGVSGDPSEAIFPPSGAWGEDWVDVQCQDVNGDDVDVRVVFVATPSWVSRFGRTKFVPLKNVVVLGRH